MASLARHLSSTTRPTLRRFLAGGLALGFFTLAAPSVAPESAQAAESCVTKAEYGQVKKGMTKGRVHNIFDFSGKVIFANPGKLANEGREYRMCTGWKKATGHTRVQVQYNNYAAQGGPLRVVYKQHY